MEDTNDTLFNDGDDALATLMRKAARSIDSETNFTLPCVGTVVAERYVLEAQLGRGGMGAVYRARHQLTGKQFAIKWLLPDLTQRPDAVQRFMREARVGGKFEHPNVVEVYDIGRHENCHYIVMELVDGETVSQRLCARGRFSAQGTCRLLIPVLRGVHAAHRAGVIHRDLKPHNIILTRDEHGEEIPKVVDFGISKVLPQAEPTHTTETAEDVIIGTPEYMAPEQLRRQPMDARVDVYAIGVIAYQLLSGVLPFSADNRTDLICKILTEPAAPLSALADSVPMELTDVIAKAMSRDPAARYSSMRELAHALEPFAAGTRFAPTTFSLDDTAEAASGGLVHAGPQGSRTPFAGESSVRGTPKRALLLTAAGTFVLAIALTAWIASRRMAEHNEAQVRQPYLADTPPEPAPVSVSASAEAPAVTVTQPPAAGTSGQVIGEHQAPPATPSERRTQPRLRSPKPSAPLPPAAATQTSESSARPSPPPVRRADFE